MCYHDVVQNPRVLMIGWEMPPHNSGGLGTACAGMAQALTADGVNLQITLPYQADDYPSDLHIVSCSASSADGDHLYAPPFNAYTPAKKSSHRQHLPHPGSWMEDRVEEYAQKVLEFARKHQAEFDIVHAHDWMTMPAAILIKEELGKPYVAHIHSTEYDRSLSEDLTSYISQCELEGMRLSDKVLAVSYYTKRLLVTKYGIDPEKIDVVHNGVVKFLQNVATPAPEFAHHRPVVVFMGRLTMQKGPDYFLELAQKVLARRPDILFIVSGMGDMYQHLLLSTANKSLSANVLFSGFVRGGAQEAILKRADVFVMPSVSEPFGLVATEAAMLHTPVIASKNSGVVEILPDSPQFDFWDTDAMAQSVLQLINDPDYREQVVRNQFAHLEQNTWKKTARAPEKIYRQVSPAAPKKKRSTGKKRTSKKD